MLSRGHNQALGKRSSLKVKFDCHDNLERSVGNLPNEAMPDTPRDELGVNRGRRHESRRRTLYQIELQNRASCKLYTSARGLYVDIFSLYPTKSFVEIQNKMYIFRSEQDSNLQPRVLPTIAALYCY